MENGMTPADIGAIMGNRDGEGFGGGAWWIIILFLFVFMGGGCWGNRQGDYSNTPRRPRSSRSFSISNLTR